jgi:phosphoesterase RecJ-like protein
MSETQPSGLSASPSRLDRTHLSHNPQLPRHSQDGERQGRLQPSERDPILDTQSWDATVDLIHRSSSILLICHVSPDGDAIGSLLGLGLGLQALAKEPTLACADTPPDKFSFLPGFESIVNTIDLGSFDLVIGLDSSDPLRLGRVYETDHLAGVPLINIDHHVTNLYFGDVNLVDTGAASTAEIILTLLDHLGVSIDEDGTPNKTGIASCLLTGIVTDTLSFRTSNVTPRVLKAALRLVEAGASLSQVTHYAFNQRPLNELNVLAVGLGRLQTEAGLAWSEISLADRYACGDGGNGDAGLVGMLARTREVHIAAVFTEKENNQVEISFRADPGFDVSQLALSLGGGGHPAAAGCTVEGPLEAAKAQVLPLLRAALEKHRKSNRP